MKNNNTIIKRLADLRSLMKSEEIDAVIVPTADYHNSEYISDYFKSREYISGFTGSAGTALICSDEAGLWTDSRYYLQAEQQLEGTSIKLYPMQEAGVPSITEYLEEKLRPGQTLAFDGRTVSVGKYRKLADTLEPRGINIVTDADLVSTIWKDRPAMPVNPVFELGTEFAGLSRAEKVKGLRADIKDRTADWLLVSDLSEIAWLLNLRGSDVHCNPVFMSYVLISERELFLFTDSGRFEPELAARLETDGVSILPYGEISEKLKRIDSGEKLWLSAENVSCALLNSVAADVDIIDDCSPVMLKKASKSRVEQENAIKAHIKDGVAVTKWIYWLKKAVRDYSDGNNRTPVSEISAAAKLHEFRHVQDNFMGDSFDPIIAFGAHAAIVHYSATAESNALIEASGMLLADTGGHYLEGTTDVTRTLVMGDITDEERSMFTAVLRGHIALARACFKIGCNGGNLDILARKPLWEMGKDYGHGTGHGVGHFLNVHEDPVLINWTANGNIRTSPALEEGMITSDEPGYYKPGAFGIRHENLLLCKKNTALSDGEFLNFLELTLVPFDRDGIDASQMTKEEKAYLNAYHKRVRDTLSTFMNADEKIWLEAATAEI